MSHRAGGWGYDGARSENDYAELHAGRPITITKAEMERYTALRADCSRLREENKTCRREVAYIEKQCERLLPSLKELHCDLKSRNDELERRIKHNCAKLQQQLAELEQEKRDLLEKRVQLLLEIKNAKP